MTSPRQTARSIIAEIAGSDPESLVPDAELIGDLGIDSPSALKLLVELEERLGIEISDEDAARMNTVGDVLDYVDRVTV